jgi:hypothetical protein
MDVINKYHDGKPCGSKRGKKKPMKKKPKRKK